MFPDMLCRVSFSSTLALRQESLSYSRVGHGISVPCSYIVAPQRYVPITDITQSCIDHELYRYLRIVRGSLPSLDYQPSP